MDMRVCRRLMPFGEHRSWTEVLETEALSARREAGDRLSWQEIQHHDRLLRRAVMPPEPEPPAAA